MKKSAKTHRLSTMAELTNAGLVSRADAPKLDCVAARYAIAVTPHMTQLIDPDNPDDPVARQFIPTTAELDHGPEEVADPIGDNRHSPVKGIVHRYQDRVLLKVISVCPVYCRFCFRREMVGPGSDGGKGLLKGAALNAALDYIAIDRGIREVIVTGGDPFMLSQRRIGDLTKRLSAFDHIRIIRWHSRVPIVDPARITPALVRALKPRAATTNVAVKVAVHVNHPRELAQAARSAIGLLVDNGIHLLSQSVLLKGINDNVETLAALFRKLVALRIQPYYLHHGDLAPGTAQFRTTLDEGQALMAALRRRLPDRDLPRYVLDIPGGYGKVPVGPEHMERESDQTWRVTDRAGRVHRYPPRL
ncbi:MAG TPA: lysine-2,3-aminomutase-like protein [Rhodobacteraceae bacterium]|nr:lysine-2,3-aminomutase-like protein [Paracoccaceae bacterium]